MADFVKKGVDAGQRAFRARLLARLREMFAPFADRVPLSDLMKAGAEIYRKGKYDGESLAYYRYVVAPRKKSA